MFTIQYSEAFVLPVLHLPDMFLDFTLGFLTGIHNAKFASKYDAAFC